MKKRISLLLAICITLVLFVGCGAKNDPSKLSDISASADNNDLSILWASGGNGEFINYAVKYLQDNHGANVDLEYNTEAHEVLRPQIIAGNPPDITMVQHSFFDYFEAIQEGAFYSIDDYIKLAVNDSEETVEDVVGSSLIDSMRVDGQAYLLLANVNVSGLYYDKALFDEKGWDAPQTWDEFIALCEQIKIEEPDIAPFIYPGMYPYYLEYFFLPNILSLGDGMNTLAALNNMEEGAWASEPVVEAAKRIELMVEKGYFANGLISMSHTEAQMEFIGGRAAMICGGSWLDNEMAGNWPEGFELTFMSTPGGNGANDEQFVRLSGNLFGFPSASENKNYNGQFLQAYYSEKSAIQAAEECGVVITTDMVDIPQVADVLSPAVVQTYEVANGCTQYFSLYNMWYSEFYTELQNALTALVSGDLTAEEFAQALEAEAKKVRDDDSITKYTVG